MRTKLLLPTVAALLVARLFASAQAWAQTPSPGPSAENKTETRRLIYQKGSDALRAKNWAEAERLFKQLWVEHATYDVAIGLGQSELLQKKYRDAAEHLAFGIRNYPPREKLETLEMPKQALLAARKHVASLRVLVDRPNAKVFVDDLYVGTTPLEGELFVEGGAHTVEARYEGLPAKRQTIDAKVDGEQSLQLDLGEEPGPAPLLVPATTASGPTSSGLETNSKKTTHAVEARTVALWTGVGVTAVSLGLGVGFALKASSASKDAGNIQSQLPPGTCQLESNASLCASLEDSLNKRDNANLAATISFAVAGAAAAATTVMFLVWPTRRTEAAAQVHVVPIATLNTAGLVINGNF